MSEPTINRPATRAISGPNPAREYPPSISPFDRMEDLVTALERLKADLGSISNRLIGPHLHAVATEAKEQTVKATMAGRLPMLDLQIRAALDTCGELHDEINRIHDHI